MPQKVTNKNKNLFNVQYLADGIIKKIEDGEFKTYKIDENKPTIEVENYKTAGANIATIWLDKGYYTTKGSNVITEQIGRNSFSYPKPVELVYEIINRVSNNNSVILDFFAGSGTTAQAVLELNKQDGGNRRFILCTNNENNICTEVTYPRVKTVITGKRQDGSTYSEGIPANLKYYRTDFVSRDEEYLSDELLEHIIEMIQLEHGVKIDNKRYFVLLDEDEADELAQKRTDYPDIKEIYVAKYVLFTTEQTALFADVEIKIIPDYYFEFELRPANKSQVPKS